MGFNSVFKGLKQLKRSYMFRSYDHPQGAYFKIFSDLSLNVLNCNFSKEQSMLPEDDRMIETCRSVLSVLM